MDQDVFYIADDERNAVVDQRTGGNRVGPWNRRTGPGRTVVVPAGQRRPTVVYTGGNAPAAGYSYAQPQMFVPPQPLPFVAPFAARFGMTTGELIDAGIQIFAAIQSLPAAPLGQEDVTTNVENLVTYQQALAAHAKRDEQLRTVGNLLMRILK